MGSGGTENKQSRSYMIIFFNIMKWLNCQVYITVVFLSSFNILGSEKRPRECCNVWRVKRDFSLHEIKPQMSRSLPKSGGECCEFIHLNGTLNGVGDPKFG